MKKSIFIVFGGAVFVAFVAAFAVQLSLGSTQKEPIKIEREARVNVLVAAKDLNIGQELVDSSLHWQSWPKATVFNGAIIQKSNEKPLDVLSGRLRRDVAQGEPVLKSSLVGQSKGNFVAASLLPGMRAVAIRVSAESMVGGFLEPGDNVDVILTYKESIRTESDEDPRIKKLIELNLDKFAAETILENVNVLAIDQKAQRPDEGKVKVGKTVTLAVKAREAEKLALAGQLGDLTLSLRGIGDDKKADANLPTITDARLTSIGDELFQKSKDIIQSEGMGSKNTLKIFNGAQMQAISVR